MIDLWSKIFGFGASPDYFRVRAICEAGYLDGSHYDWDASRLGVIDRQIVAHFGVWGYDMRVGSATVRCGGIGAVCTHPGFRKRGILMRVAQAVMLGMHRCGYDVSLLYGINDFYDRLGYRRAFSHQHYTLRTADLPTEKPAATTRRFKVVRRDDTDELYNRAFAGFTGTAVRPTFRKTGDLRESVGFRWADARGKLAGYVYVEHQAKRQRLRCYEAVGDTTQTLRVLGALARKHGCDAVELVNQPAGTPLMQAVRRMRHEAWSSHNPNGGPMARTVNLRTTLTHIADELHARLRGSTLNRWRGNLLIDDGNEQALLHIGARGVVVGDAEQSPHVIKTKGHAVQLVWGTDTPETLMDQAGMKAVGDAAAVVSAMFPAQQPTLLPFDQF